MLTGSVTEAGFEDAGFEGAFGDGAAAFDDAAAFGWLKKAVRSVGRGISSVAGSKFGGLILGPALRVGQLGASIARGQNVVAALKETGRRFAGDAKLMAQAAKYAAPVASLVPGVGTGVAAALSAAASLANGEKITDALMAGARGAIPGGPLATSAFDVGIALAKGQNPTAAVLAAARKNIPGGAAAQAAFDTAVALAKGQSLQKAAQGAVVGAARQYVGGKIRGLPGGAMLGQLTAMGVEVDPDPLGGSPMTEVGALDLARRRPRFRGGMAPLKIEALIVGEPERIARAVMRDPSLRRLPVLELARKLGATDQNAREGLASVARALVRRKPVLAAAPRMAQSIGDGESLDALMMRLGRPAPPRFSAYFRAAGADDAGVAPGDSALDPRRAEEAAVMARWSVKSTQNALNKLATKGKTPAVGVTGVLDLPTRAAIRAFSQVVWGNEPNPDYSYQVIAAIHTEAAKIAGPGVTPPAQGGGGVGGGIAFDPEAQQAQRDLTVFFAKVGTKVPADWKSPADEDGKAGPRTQKAAAFFQSVWNSKSAGAKLRTDGLLDANTKAALANESRGVPLPAALAPAAPAPALPQLPPGSTSTTTPPALPPASPPAKPVTPPIGAPSTPGSSTAKEIESGINKPAPGTAPSGPPTGPAAIEAGIKKSDDGALLLGAALLGAMALGS